MSKEVGIDEAPVVVQIEGRPWYQFSDRLLPVISGGEGPEKDDDKEEESDDDEDEDADKGEQDDSDDDAEDKSDDDDKDEQDDYEAPVIEGRKVTQRDLNKILKGKKKADKDAEKFRKLAEDLKKSGGATQATINDDEREKVRTEGRTEAETTWKPRFVKKAAAAELIGAGFQHDPERPKRLEKILRTIDMEDIDVDEDGEVDGLEDWVDEVKADYPEMFVDKNEQQAKPATSKRVDSGDKGKKAAKEELSNADKLRNAMLGIR